MDTSVADVLDKLQLARSEIELRATIESFLWSNDISTYAYIAFLPEQGPMGINNHPQHWLERYAECGYLDIDPVISRARGQLLPFQWGDITRSLEKREKAFMAEGREVGTVSGATVPIPGPGRSAGMMFYSSDVDDTEFARLWLDRKYDLHLVSVYFHSTFVELFKKAESGTYHLTLRERECLLWTARGKTAWETSEILHISERTVVFHLRNAATKLGCYSKYQAVLKAILLELISV